MNEAALLGDVVRVTDPATAPLSGAPRRRLLRRLVCRRGAALALAFLGLVVVAAVAAPVLAPQDPNHQDLLRRLEGPSMQHWLGTDGKGRDVLSRILVAARVALMAPLISVGIGAAIGVPAGLLAGLRKNRIDALLGRVADTVMSVPAVVMAVAIVAILGPGLTNAMIAIGLVFAPLLFRVVRGATLKVGSELYIDSARSIGCSTPRLLWSHVLPNVAAPLVVQVSLLMGFALLAEASLSFLGLGVQIPNASWGSMLRTAYDDKFTAPYGVVPPGIVLTLTILSFNTAGDALLDAISGGRRR